MVWIKPGQRLDFGFTAKGSHKRTGGSVTRFMAAITYGKGVIAVVQYFGRIKADAFSSFVCERFPSMFRKYPNSKGKLFLQDGDPSQKSCKSSGKIGSRKFSIPACSLGLNPVGNIFLIVKKELHQDALKA